MIRKTAEVLLKKLEFSSDFDYNKKKLKEVPGLNSKLFRNKIAGYISKKLHNESNV